MGSPGGLALGPVLTSITAILAVVIAIFAKADPIVSFANDAVAMALALLFGLAAAHTGNHSILPVGLTDSQRRLLSDAASPARNRSGPNPISGTQLRTLSSFIGWPALCLVENFVSSETRFQIGIQADRPRPEKTCRSLDTPWQLC